MYCKIIIVMLAAVASGKPQLGFSQPRKQTQSSPVEGTVFGDSFVQNRAVSSHSVVNEFLNQEDGESMEHRRGTTPRIDIHTKVYTEVYASDNLTTDDHQRNAVTQSEILYGSRNDERNGKFDNTNVSATGTAKVSKSLRTNKRKIYQNPRRTENIPTHKIQNNLEPNITDANKVLYTNTAKSSQRSQPDDNYSNRVLNISSNNRTFTNLHNDNSNQTDRVNPDYRSNGDISDQNRRPVNGTVSYSNGSPSNSSFQSGRVHTDDRKDDMDMNEGDHEGDRWIWGYSNVTEKGVTGTTPDLDDRANFEAGSCPTGQAKIGTKCVDKD